MAVSDYNREKPLDVASVTGTPTVSKAVYIRCVDGNDSTTGTGDVVIDFANISAESDFAVYDENDSLLNYWIDEFDTTNNVIGVFVWDAWARDGTTQAKVVYGSGPASSEESPAATWNQTGQNLVGGWPLNESSSASAATDISPNGNDGTIGADVTMDTAAIYATGGDFQDTDDSSVEIGDLAALEPANFTSVSAVQIAATPPEEGVLYGKEWGGPWNKLSVLTDGTVRATTTAGGSTSDVDSTTAIDDGSSHIPAITYDGTTVEVYVDGSSENADTGISGDADYSTDPATIGGRPGTFGGPDQNRVDGVIDMPRVYSEAKSGDWMQAEWDMSPPGGQTFFSQQAASATSGGQTANAAVASTTASAVDPTASAGAVSAAAVFAQTTAAGVNPAINATNSVAPAIASAGTNAPAVTATPGAVSAGAAFAQATASAPAVTASTGAQIATAATAATAASAVNPTATPGTVTAAASVGQTTASAVSPAASPGAVAAAAPTATTAASAQNPTATPGVATVSPAIPSAGTAAISPTASPGAVSAAANTASTTSSALAVAAAIGAAPPDPANRQHVEHRTQGRTKILHRIDGLTATEHRTEGRTDAHHES